MSGLGAQKISEILTVKITWDISVFRYILETQNLSVHKIKKTANMEKIAKDAYNESPSQSKEIPPKHSCAENNRTKPIHYVQHDYHDYASVPCDDVPVDCISQYQKNHKGGIDILFPEKLHQILSDDSGDVISWASHGRCFFIHDRHKMLTNYLKPRFGINTFSSFQRQLNRYLFKLIAKKASRDFGAYYHEMFLQGRPRLCQRFRGRKLKNIFVKPLPNPTCEPDFYRMAPCTDLNMEADVDMIVGSMTNKKGNCANTAILSATNGDYNQINGTPITDSPQMASEKILLHRANSQVLALETNFHVQESSSSLFASDQSQPLLALSGTINSSI